ncbi:MAG: hypothetical protein LQ337_005403 [Flavoplaca oasis]|nr:MAG: hypothetical protein LQ337_005403 [Flavoplaca oasis]
MGTSQRDRMDQPTDDRRQHILDGLQDLAVEDAENVAKEETDGVEDEEWTRKKKKRKKKKWKKKNEEIQQGPRDSQQAEEYDSDGSADDVITKADDGNTKSQLAVGYKHDRSFVVRGLSTSTWHGGRGGYDHRDD